MHVLMTYPEKMKTFRFISETTIRVLLSHIGQISLAQDQRSSTLSNRINGEAYTAARPFWL